MPGSQRIEQPSEPDSVSRRDTGKLTFRVNALSLAIRQSQGGNWAW
jgi:hypothetical protein